MSLDKFKDTEVGKIPVNWDLVSIGDQLDLITDYHSNGSYKTLREHVDLKETQDYALMVRTTNFEQNNFTDSLRYVDKSAYEFLEKSKVYPDDIIMNKIANAGSVYLMPDLKRPVSLAMNLFLLRMKPSVNQRYVYYYLKHNEKYLKTFAQGSVTKTITKDNVKKFPLVVPPLDIQNKIDYVLSLFYKKILALENINKNLTNIVLLLFKNWFVDFNFLNENNKPYKNDNGELKDSILGLIPKDWNVDSLGKYVEIDRGFSYKGKYLSEEGIPLINLGNILPNSEFRLEKLKFYSGEFDKKYKVNVGDILVANTDLTQNRLVLGSPIIVPSLIDEEDIIYSHHINRLSNFKLPKFYIFYNLLSERYNHMVSGYATGTTVLAISKESITNYKILIPPEELILKFDELAKNIEKIKDNNLIEMEKLTKLRNILLPKLMSGEIDVSQLDYLNNSIER